MSATCLRSNRLFVPLNRSAYLAFRDGHKTWELRLHRRQWTTRQLVIGRRVELRCGYARGQSVWGHIADVQQASRVATLFDALGHSGIVPAATTRAEAIRIARDTIGSADAPVIAFRVILDDGSLSDGR